MTAPERTAAGMTVRLDLYARILRVQGLAVLIKERCFQDDGDQLVAPAGQRSGIPAEVLEGMDLLCELLRELAAFVDRDALGDLGRGENPS